MREPVPKGILISLFTLGFAVQSSALTNKDKFVYVEVHRDGRHH
jgi:hypothetical protein